MRDDLQETINFFDHLTKLDPQAQSEEIMQRREHYCQLYQQIGLFLVQSCGIPNKLYEKISQLQLVDEYGGEALSVRHVNDGYGADIQIHSNATATHQQAVVLQIECKHSSAKKTSNYHTNWNFTIPGSIPLRNFSEIYVVLQKKFGEGYVQLKATSAHDGQLLNEYRLDNGFMAFYLARHAYRKQTRRINLGRDRCSVCLHYHFICELLRMADLFLERTTNAYDQSFLFMEVEWLRIDGRMASQCPVKK